MSRGLMMGAGGLTLAGAGLLVWYFASNGAPAQAGEGRPIPVAVEPDAVDPAILERPLVLTLETRTAQAPWGAFAAVGADGQVAVDAERAVAALVQLKPALDRPPRNAKLDLERRELVPEVPGLAIDVYGALGMLRAALATQAAELALPGVATPADVTRETLGNIDITHVLGRFSTKFAVAEKLRNDNLKLAASKLDGHVLQPGAEFSFNDVVGDRTEKEGYKIAHVITAGEMVDGLAGGTCQISTTLHGASFFAGLEIVKSTPHSRPSTYVQMGLDATVVYPTTDLELRNPYDFPVVIHYVVGRGEAIVEILGKRRPYDEIAFEREIEEEMPFDTVTREDDTLPVGSMVIEQEGFPGYKATRFRRYYKDGKLVKSDRWALRYSPVTEYSRMGSNPDPNLPWPAQPKPHGPQAPKQTRYRLAQ
jgi:vancomycin resistance protein YoaR